MAKPQEFPIPSEPPLPELPVGRIVPFSELFLRTETGYTVHRQVDGGEWVRLPDVVESPWPPEIV